VLSLIERGRQSFTHKGTKYPTPPGGLILINPGVVHTGEAADTQGFELRALYPSTSLMEKAVFELTDGAGGVLRSLHLALFGTAIQTHLKHPHLKMVVNIVLSLSLVYTAISLTGII
jgi:hypothetical protein